jgi:3-oxoacyl-[acyl-carrier-protein] synthase II
MGILARCGDDPGRAVRPWDRARSGFLVGAGAGVLVLEGEDHARARGVTPYAELAGGASGADAYHMTDLNPDPASQIGHLLGAAGAAELAITCLAVHHGFVPPTLNLDDPDSACDLDGTPGVGRPRAIGAALKLSIGFGGHLAAAVVKRVDT